MGMLKKLLCKMGMGNCGEHPEDAPMEEQPTAGPSQPMEEPTPAPEAPQPQEGGMVGGNTGESPFSEGGSEGEGEMKQ
jgi:hypothetical protein